MPKNMEYKVGLFVIVATLLVAASLGFVAYKKDLFAKIHTVTLKSSTADDLVEGMPVVYAGIKIGRLHSLELNKDGVVMIKIKVPERHLHWIRKDSTVTVDKPLFGAARLIVSTPKQSGQALASGDVLEVISANKTSEMLQKINPVLERLTEIAGHVEQTTARIASPEGDINKILSNTEQMTAKFSKRDSLLEMAISDQESIRALHDSLRKTREIVLQVDAILKKADALMVKVDENVMGRDGTVPLVNRILKDVLVKLEKVAVSLDHMNKMTADIADSTNNMKVLRQEIDTTVNTISDITSELGKKIPFRRPPEIRLP